MIELRMKLGLLIEKLRIRRNQADGFFEQILMNLNDKSKTDEAISSLLSCFSIVQYANFTNDEEKLMTEIWELANIEFDNKKFE